MSVNIQFERLYDQVELVQGAGSRGKGQLCIMSFVAYLAGAAHTDTPPVVSSFIRKYAIPLNDTVPSILRQDLKPFAPRIIGTNDGQDLRRAEVLFQTITNEVLPRVAVDFPGGLRDQPLKLWSQSSFDVWSGANGSNRSLASLIREFQTAHEARDCLSMGKLAGALLAALTRLAPTPSAQQWYWAKALELFDRLCDIGAEHRPIASCEIDTASVQLDTRAVSSAPRGTPTKDTVTAKRVLPRAWAAVRELVCA